MNPVVIWPLILYFGVAIILVGGMLGLSYILGERHREKATGEPYESGMPPTGSARLRFDVKFYMIAMFFVIFDLEAAFLFGWVIAARELGWTGYAEVLVFVGILLVALIYLWRAGALDWGPGQRRAQESSKAE
jgi:NADH-quinone oxidoreductase subunit A